LVHWYSADYGDQPTNRNTVEVAKLKLGDDVLDIGCGSSTAVRGITGGSLQLAMPGLRVHKNHEKHRSSSYHIHIYLLSSTHIIILRNRRYRLATSEMEIE
jgi:hypothetical protein